jgi:hypothetical protein
MKTSMFGDIGVFLFSAYQILICSLSIQKNQDAEPVSAEHINFTLFV